MTKPASPELTTAQFDSIRALINRTFGIRFSSRDRRNIGYKLMGRMEELEMDDFDAYTRMLQSDTANRELARAINVLTNNETYFFREDCQLRAFATELLPKLKTANQHKRQLTIWSAGCSSGEEAYTAAILISESNLFRDFDVKIIGTDISTRRLSMAREGLYRNLSFRSTPADIKNRYFSSAGEGWKIDPAIQKMCRFSKLNLADRDAAILAGKYDLIFCRNVLIYFDRNSRNETVETLFNRLHPGGYLLLGHTESLLNDQTGFRPIHLSEELVYQRPADLLEGPHA